MDSLKNKTLWDWMGLLFIPMALLIGGYLLNQSQITQQNKIEEARIDRQNQLESRRIKEQRAIEDERNYINILNNYRRSITDLMINGGLNDTGYHPVAVQAATALTASTAPQLDGERKGQMLLFLYNARLISKDNPRIYLAGIDLSGANLARARLKGINLPKSNLSSADFSDADLTGANLSSAVLIHADLRYAKLSKTNFTDANLKDTRFYESSDLETSPQRAELIQALTKGSHWQEAVFSPRLQDELNRFTRDKNNKPKE
ncbi:pentapeptide repeat-containing protein [Thalassomonas viridans]|uniref:Pentapeptide repeat-containing protein n=1 Tax=Thalassomonas viridans TaxID=137584 RepID=A0AAE9Z7P5_9GAMM|nr:pentapeptide repeat-containing protein [Thalassomonas viridans]WDE07777.1 pentapeptide repeat-containing protein [Thalassomonas viridans]